MKCFPWCLLLLALVFHGCKRRVTSSERTLLSSVSSEHNLMLGVFESSDGKTPLKGVALDKERVPRAFESIGYKPTVLFNDGLAAAKTATYKAAIDVKDGTLVWYFAGHGFRREGLAFGKERASFKVFLDEISAARRSQQLPRLKRLIVVVDSCESAQVLEIDNGSKGLQLQEAEGAGEADPIATQAEFVDMLADDLGLLNDHKLSLAGHKAEGVAEQIVLLAASEAQANETPSGGLLGGALISQINNVVNEKLELTYEVFFSSVARIVEAGQMRLAGDSQQVRWFIHPPALKGQKFEVLLRSSEQEIPKKVPSLDRFKSKVCPECDVAVVRTIKDLQDYFGGKIGIIVLGNEEARIREYLDFVQKVKDPSGRIPLAITFSSIIPLGTQVMFQIKALVNPTAGVIDMALSSLCPKAQYGSASGLAGVSDLQNCIKMYSAQPPSPRIVYRDMYDAFGPDTLPMFVDMTSDPLDCGSSKVAKFIFSDSDFIMVSDKNKRTALSPLETWGGRSAMLTKIENFKSSTKEVRRATAEYLNFSFRQSAATSGFHCKTPD